MIDLSGLGIDLRSLILYIVNFGVVVFFVGKYLTNPILNMLDKRTSNIKSNLFEAENLKLQLAKQKTEIEEEKEAMHARYQTELDEFKKKIAQKRKEAEMEITKERNKMIEQTQEELAKQKENLKDDIKREVKETVSKMVDYIVSNKIPEEVVAQSADEAWEKYSN